jgi:hypothetical protein
VGGYLAVFHDQNAAPVRLRAYMVLMSAIAVVGFLALTVVANRWYVEAGLIGAGLSIGIAVRLNYLRVRGTTGLQF